jgi:HK97 family phage portal protein
LSPITYANKVIGSSLSAEDFSYQFFTGGGHPTAIYYADKELNGEQAQQIKDADRRARAGGNREPMVTGSGLRRETIQLDPNETQFIDLMRFNVEQACRFWRVPPSMVYASVSGQNVTYANVSDADLSYLKNTLDGYLVRLEAAFTDLLPRPQYVRANRDAVLRSDQKTRYANYQIGIRNGWRNRNEIRALEDEPPIPDTGDEYVWPPVGQGAGMDSKPPSSGGVVEEGPSQDTVTPAPVAPTAKPATPVKK